MPENERHEQSRRAGKGGREERRKNATHSPSDFHSFVGGRGDVGHSYSFDFLFRVQERGKRSSRGPIVVCLFAQQCDTLTKSLFYVLSSARLSLSRPPPLPLRRSRFLSSLSVDFIFIFGFIFAFSRSFPCCYFILCSRLALCESPLFRRSSGGSLLEHTRRPRLPDNRAIPSDRISNGNWLSRRCFEK